MNAIKSFFAVTLISVALIACQSPSNTIDGVEERTATYTITFTSDSPSAIIEYSIVPYDIITVSKPLPWVYDFGPQHAIYDPESGRMLGMNPPKWVYFSAVTPYNSHITCTLSINGEIVYAVENEENTKACVLVNTGLLLK